jgi:hypothetical protein
MYKKIKDWAIFHRPPYATIKEWSEHYRRFKEEAPVRHFFFRLVPRAFRRHILTRIRIYSDWFRYRFHPHHRYHIVKTQLSPGYYDADQRMLHAVFGLICDYVEIELAALQGSKKYRDKIAGKFYLLEMIEKDFHAKWQEILDLYVWWNQKFLSFDNYLDEQCGEYPIIQDNKHKLHILEDMDDRTVIDTILTKHWYDRREELLEEHERETEEMLIRACKIRTSLWT